MYKKIEAPKPLLSLVRGLRGADAAKAYDSDTKVYRMATTGKLKLIHIEKNPWGQKLNK